jgi:hypothetical protein
MPEYPKIQTLWKRDLDLPGKPIREGDWTTPEFEYLANNDWVWYEKIDGTNIRLEYSLGQMTIKGRTDNAQLPGPLVDKLRKQFPDSKAFVDVFDAAEATVYGEGFGPKIQSGGFYGPEQDFIVFDVRVGKWWLKDTDVDEIAKRLGLLRVPLVGFGTLPRAVEFVRGGLKSVLAPGHQAEGIVARPTVDLLTRSGERVICKVKCRDFAGR